MLVWNAVLWWGVGRGTLLGPEGTGLCRGVGVCCFCGRVLPQTVSGVVLGVGVGCGDRVWLLFENCIVDASIF